MTFGSVFAGIGGVDLGFERAGLRCAFQVEIDPDCIRVLERHYPDTLRLPDVRECGKHNLPAADVLCGGFPCQDLSVAGKRAGLGGERSGLFYEFTRLVRELRPAIAIIENVPGLLSSDRGRDFGLVLNELVKCGARDIAWRVLDAQYFGLAQRRRRVFVVADFRGERAGQILFESPCGCRHSPSRREARTEVAGSLGGGTKGRGWSDDLDRAGAFVVESVKPGHRRASGNRGGENLVASTLRSQQHSPGVNGPGRGGEDDQNIVTVPSLTARYGKGTDSDAIDPIVYNPHRTLQPDGTVSEGFKPDTITDALHGPTGNKEPLCVVPIQETGKRASERDGTRDGIGVGNAGDPSFTLGADSRHGIGFIINSHNSEAKESNARESDIARTLDQSGGHAPGQGGTVVAFNHQSGGSTNFVGGKNEFTDALQSDQTPAVQAGMTVRRLMPVECERLQGFPDGWTDGSDSARYRMIGNAVAVPVAEWLGKRIAHLLRTRNARTVRPVAR